MVTPRPNIISVASGGTVRAGRAAAVPSWVPATAWQWADVPGTRWTDAVKSDGTGVAPSLVGGGALGGYESVWDYSGPVYSRANHEFWMFGGGHAGTTVNILTTTTLGASPAVTMACAPSSVETRSGVFNSASYLAGNGYWPDGKPYSPHSYENNLFVDARGEFVSFCLEYVASSADGTSIGGGAQGFKRIPAFASGGSAWLPAGTYADVPLIGFPAEDDLRRGPRVVSADGAAVYYWAEGRGLRKFTFAANTHSAVGGTTARPGTVSCLMPGGASSLHVDRDSGPGVVLKTCNLTTGAQAALTVSGDTLPSGLVVYGIEYVASIDKYVAVWVDSTAFNSEAATISSIYVVTYSVSGSTATAQNKPMTGTAPTKCGSICGMGFDPVYGCVLLNLSRSQLIKAFKVAQ